MSSPTIQWYPGHIAKAERLLMDQLKRVDVVLEVRDARIPFSTHHPQVDQWVADKERVLVLNRVDMIPVQIQEQWLAWFKAQGQQIYFTDAQHGTGTKGLAKAAALAGAKMNQRRTSRGMKPRAVRAVMIGFPNVGKSALINRLVQKRAVESARKPGVTKSLRWVRVGQALDLLDAPGVLPAKLNDQAAAVKLALCDDIGQASYDNQRVASELVEQLKILQGLERSPVNEKILCDRYGVDEAAFTGEEYVLAVAEERYQGDRERTARHILNDFRKGLLGKIPLELPPN